MIHKTAIVSPNAQVGENVSIGPYTIIHGNVSLGNDVTIGAHCELGIATDLADKSSLIIGDNSLIRSHSVFYESSYIENNLVTGHGVVVRENSRIGRDFQLGSMSEIQGHCTIGNFVRTQSNVFISQRSTIGNFVWLMPYVVLTNDPHPPSNVCLGVLVEDYVVVAAQSIVLPGVRLAEGTLVAAKSNVTRDTNANTVVMGNPAREHCKIEDIKMRDGDEKPAYPWSRHFHRGYPEEVVTQWLALTEE